jgi:hypothetical protein
MPTPSNAFDWQNFSFGPHAPDLWLSLSEADRELRAKLSSDQCIVDGQYFFVLGLLEIPVRGMDKRFVWRVWLSLSEKSFSRCSELWTTPGRESEPPVFGWLQSQLPYAPGTLNLKTMVQMRPVGERPSVLLEPTDHPLAVEFREGITVERAEQLARLASKVF